MPYTILLLVMAIIQHTRGNQHVWTHPVHEVNFFAAREGVNPAMVPQQQMYSPQPMVQQPLQQQMPVQYTGTPPVNYAALPPQQAPMNTGYAQPPANTGYAQAPTNAGYPPAPANTGYLPDPANPGYAPAPANPGYSQGPTNPAYVQA